MSMLVFHSSSLGVTEHARDVTGLAGDFECMEDRLLRVQGTLDEGLTFVGQVGIGIGADRATPQKFPTRAYVQADGAGELTAQVLTTGTAHTYAQNLRRGRNRRFVFGRGIRDAYLGYVFSNPDGQPFLIDQIEFGDRDSEQRKV